MSDPSERKPGTPPPLPPQRSVSMPPPLPRKASIMSAGFVHALHRSLTDPETRAPVVHRMLFSPDMNATWHRQWVTMREMAEEEHWMAPVGLSQEIFREGQFVNVFITLPAARVPGEVYFVMLVFGPAEPSWTPQDWEKWAQVPFRLFVLLRAEKGTVIEEWTTLPPPEVGPFAMWVLNHAVRPFGTETVMAPPGEDAMEAAMAKGRETLPAVLERFLSGELADAHFSVKVPVVDGKLREFFWLSQMAYADGKFLGVIDADPQVVTTVKRGDRWTARLEDAVDWMYGRHRKMYGNYTLRAMLPKMPPDQAAQYAALLAEEGAEAG